MTEKAYQRLLPFLHRKSARQRIILYLIADGYAVGDLVAMPVSELRKLKLPLEISICRDEVLAGFKNSMAFVYPNGKRVPHTAYYRLIRSTAEKVLGRPMSQEQFRRFIQQGKTA